MPTHSLLQQGADEIERTFKINVLAHFWVIQAILPSMLNNNHGHIISISSCAGLVGLENLVPYCGTKWAVKGYMEALFHEIRSSKPNSQIKFTTVYPYMVDTGLCKKPTMRFEDSMNMESPETVARKIIQAQRRDMKEIAIPEYFLYL
ncbi:dehydrogenase, partial [Oryctes borbonicus]